MPAVDPAMSKKRPHGEQALAAASAKRGKYASKALRCRPQEEAADKDDTNIEEEQHLPLKTMVRKNKRPRDREQEDEREYEDEELQLGKVFQEVILSPSPEKKRQKMKSVSRPIAVVTDMAREEFAWGSSLPYNKQQSQQQLYEAQDFSPLLVAQDWKQLLYMLKRDGALLLRKVHDPKIVHSIYQLIQVLESSMNLPGQQMNKEKQRPKEFVPQETLDVLMGEKSHLAQLLRNILGVNTVTMLDNYTGYRVKPPGTSTEKHGDISWFKYMSSFFTDFDTTTTRTRFSARQASSSDGVGCAHCHQHLSDSVRKRALTCSICTRSYHVTCIKAVEDQDTDDGCGRTKMMKALLANRFEIPSWHCRECAADPIDMYIIWGPMVTIRKTNEYVLQLIREFLFQS
jgi:hypothetical protein